MLALLALLAWVLVFAQVLGQTGGNQLRAAQMLGINRNTLHKKLAEFKIDGSEGDIPVPNVPINGDASDED